MSIELHVRCHNDCLASSLTIYLLFAIAARLEMDRNDIVGSLPAEFGNMRRLGKTVVSEKSCTNSGSGLFY